MKHSTFIHFVYRSDHNERVEHLHLVKGAYHAHMGDHMYGPIGLGTQDPSKCLYGEVIAVVHDFSNPLKFSTTITVHAVLELHPDDHPRKELP